MVFDVLSRLATGKAQTRWDKSKRIDNMDNKLDAMMKMMEASEKRMAEEMSGIKSSLAGFKPDFVSIKSSVDAIVSEVAKIKANLEEWKLDLENRVGDLSTAVKDLRCQLDQITNGKPVSALGTPPGKDAALAESSLAGAKRVIANFGPAGHRVDKSHRCEEMEDTPPPFSSPVTGQHVESLVHDDHILGSDSHVGGESTPARGVS